MTHKYVLRIKLNQTSNLDTEGCIDGFTSLYF